MFHRTLPAEIGTAQRAPTAARPARRRILSTAAARALLVGGMLGSVASVVGCNRYEVPIFDPRAIELIERRGANEPPLRLEPYPTTLQAVPTPEEVPAPGEPRLPNDAYLGNLPTTGRGYTQADVVPMSLREVITRAVLYNSDVKVAGYEPAINAQRVIEQEAVFDPAVFVRAVTERTDSGLATAGNVSGNQVTGFTDNTETNTLEGGLQQRLTTGGQARLTYGYTYTQIDNFAAAQDEDFWQNQLRLEITQPLLRDFGRDINAARIEIARGDQQISVLDFRRSLEEQLAELERVYWLLYQANKIVIVQENLLAETIETYRVLYERFIRGLDASEIPVAQALSSVKGRQADLIRAKQNVKDLSDELKRRMTDPDLPVSTSFVIVPTTDPLTAPVEFEFQTAIDSAVSNRLELGQQLIRIEQARIAERVAANNQLPRLDFIGVLGVRGIGQTTGEAASRAVDFNTPSWQFGLEFEYPLGNRAARAIRRRAQLQRLQAIEQYRNILAQVSLDIQLALNEIQASWRQAIVRTQARLASRRQLELIQRQQDLGEPITPSFVQIKLQAQEELANAAREEAAAIANYNIAIQRLQRAKGTLLKYNNVQLKEDPANLYLNRGWMAPENIPQ